MHFRFKPRRNPGSQSQHRSVNRTAVVAIISRWRDEMGRRAARIELSEEERDGLERLIRASLTPQQLAMRARIVLLLGEGLGIEGTADRLGIWRKTVSAWRARWLSGAGVRGTVADRLRDAPRCGGAGSDRGRGGMRDHCPGLQATQGLRSSAEPLECERSCPRGGETGSRGSSFAPPCGALFKKEPTSSPI